MSHYISMLTSKLTLCVRQWQHHETGCSADEQENIQGLMGKNNDSINKLSDVITGVINFILINQSVM